MRRISLTLALLMPLSAAGQPEPLTFVPHSPMTAQEMVDLKERMKGELGLTDAEINDWLADGSEPFTYRDSDIIAAFPELRGARKLSVCGNTILGGATQVVFISDTTENEIIVKTSSCTPVDSGLMCRPIKQERKYFLDAPEHFFSLENTTFEEARTILEAYEEQGVAGLTGLPAAFTARDVRSIVAVPEGYRLSLGDVYCGGCEATLVVQLESTGNETRLRRIGDPEGICF